MTPPILTSADALLSRYDVVLCDIWGVVHDGKTAYPAAGAALQRFREKGGTVVLVTNAPMTAPAIATLLDGKRVERAAWDAIVGSGDIAVREIQRQNYKRVYGIGPRPRDDSFFDAVANLVDQLETADAIACTGLLHDYSHTSDRSPSLGLERCLANDAREGRVHCSVCIGRPQLRAESSAGGGTVGAGAWNMITATTAYSRRSLAIMVLLL